MVKIPTIKIVGKNGHMAIISEADFRSGVHVRWEERELVQPEAQPEQQDTLDDYAEFTAHEIKPLADFTIKELRVLAKERGLAPGTANKDELIEMIQAHDAGGDA